MENDKYTTDLLTSEILKNVNGLKRFALSLCQDEFQSEELVAETVVKAFEHWRSLRNTGKIKQWLFRILNNQFLSNYRFKRLHSIFHVDIQANTEANGLFSLFDQITNSSLVEEGNPEKEFINKITHEQIQQAIDSLPDAFRTSLVLCDIEDFTYKEIASIMSLPVGTIRSRIARARISLQQKLWIYAQELGITNSKTIKARGKKVCTCGSEEKIEPVKTIST